MKSKNFKVLRELWDEQSEDEIENYISILKEPGALTALLNYYRASNALLKRARSEKILGDINVPTLFMWGNNDIAVGSASVEGGHQYMKGEYTYIELDGGHWLLQSNYSEVKEAIIKHLDKFNELPNNV